MIAVKDEREGLPSASSAHRYAACPGSFLLEKQFALAPEPVSEAANLGNRVHAWLAGEEITLNDEEQQIANRLKTLEESVFSAVFPDAKSVRIIREQRIWCSDDYGRKWSGKADVIYIHKGEALIIDYKTGRGPVEDCKANLQLRALAVLAWWEFKINRVTVCILQPYSRTELSLCSYYEDDLYAAEKEICDLMDKIQMPNQPRVPSEKACRYCKGRSACPEAVGEVTSIVARVNEAVMAQVSPEKMAAFLDQLPAIEATIDALKETARTMIETGTGVPGWRIGEGKSRETITNPQEVFGRFLGAGGKHEEFMACVSITKTKLKAALKEATGKKGRDLDMATADLLEGCVETKQTAGSLEKVS